MAIVDWTTRVCATMDIAATNERRNEALEHLVPEVENDHRADPGAGFMSFRVSRTTVASVGSARGFLCASFLFRSIGWPNKGRPRLVPDDKAHGLEIARAIDPLKTRLSEPVGIIGGRTFDIGSPEDDVLQA
jgi:hypothetical protein